MEQYYEYDYQDGTENIIPDLQKFIKKHGPIGSIRHFDTGSDVDAIIVSTKFISKRDAKRALRNLDSNDKGFIHFRLIS